MKRSSRLHRRHRIGLLLLVLAGITMGLVQSCVNHPEKSVVMLTTEDRQSGGTGFEVVTPNGHQYTLTNRHICDHDATWAQVDGHSIKLRVVQSSSQVDLCLLEPVATIPPLQLSDRNPQPADVVDVYGFGMLLPLTHTQGLYVGDVYMTVPVFGFIAGYATASILPGNSGSPVLDSHGKVVGVAFASGPIINNRTLLVRLEDIRSFLEVF